MQALLPDDLEIGRPSKTIMDRILLAVIAHGGRCDARNSYGETPFHTAAAQGYLPSDPGPESVRMLRSITK